jgi:hypothetical protein
MGGTYGVYGGEEKFLQDFGGGNLRERDYLEDLHVDGSIILRSILKEVGCEGVDWFRLAEGRDKCRSLMNTLMNLPFSWTAGNFLTS